MLIMLHWSLENGHGVCQSMMTICCPSVLGPIPEDLFQGSEQLLNRSGCAHQLPELLLPVCTDMHKLFIALLTQKAGDKLKDNQPRATPLQHRCIPLHRTLQPAQNIQYFCLHEFNCTVLDTIQAGDVLSLDLTAERVFKFHEEALEHEINFTVPN